MNPVTQTTEDALKNLVAALNTVRRKVLTPPKKQPLSEWADQNRIIGLGSAEAGPFRTNRAPYQREILDVCGDYRTSRIVICAAAQTCKTTIMENVIGYFMENDPSPIMMVQPNGGLATAFVEQKLEPMIEATPALRNLVASKSKRDGGNRKLEKKYTGGSLSIVSAQSAPQLRSRAIRILLLDEVDAYEHSIGDEGNPIAIAEVRTTTFPNRKIILASTPTIKDASRIEKEYLRSDQRRFYLPCPLCGEFQVLEWGGLATTFGIKWDNQDASTARYRCRECQREFTENHKLQMMLKGEWRKTNLSGEFPGFQISSLYSPWISWSELVKEWHQVHQMPDKQQEFFNLRMGEAWEDRTNRLEVHELATHIHDYNAPCPTKSDGCNGVGVITAGVDVQLTWIEAAVFGWGDKEECWLLDTPQFFGDTTTDGPWNELRDFLSTKYKTVNGFPVSISVVAIDAGNQTEIVNRKVAEFQKLGLKVIPVKGFDGARAVFEWSRYKQSGKPRLGLVGSSQAKGILLSRLKSIGVVGPGYVHFPANVLPDVLEQITAETKVTIYGKDNVPKVIWKKIRERNEQLDCWVYAFGALHSYKDILSQLAELAEKNRTGLPDGTTATPAGKQILRPRKVVIPRKIGGFGNNPWRN